MPQDDLEQFRVTDPNEIQQMGRAGNLAQFQVTRTGTPMPTAAQRPGMPAPPNMLPVYPTPGRPQPKGYAAQGYTEQQPFVLPHGPGAPAYGTPQFRQMVTQAGRNVDPKLIQRQAQRGIRQAPIVLGAAAAAGPAMIAAEGALPGVARAAYPFLSGAAKGVAADYALKAAQQLPFVGERIKRIPHSAELMEALPLIWGAASEVRAGRAIAGAAEKVAADKAAGKVIGGEEKELLKEQMAKVFSGEAKAAELKAMSKGLKAGKQAGEAAAKEAEKALEQSKPLGSLQEGTDYVPQTGPYQLHQGERVVPAPLNLADPLYGRRTVVPAMGNFVLGAAKSVPGMMQAALPSAEVIGSGQKKNVPAWYTRMQQAVTQATTPTGRAQRAGATTAQNLALAAGARPGAMQQEEEMLKYFRRLAIALGKAPPDQYRQVPTAEMQEFARRGMDLELRRSLHNDALLNWLEKKSALQKQGLPQDPEWDAAFRKLLKSDNWHDLYANEPANSKVREYMNERIGYQPPSRQQSKKPLEGLTWEEFAKAGVMPVKPDATDRAAASFLAKQAVGFKGRRYGKLKGKPIEGAFQQGGVVPKTGNYILHEGEAVLPNFSWTSRGKVGDAFQGMGLARTETPMSQRESYYGPTNAPGMISPGNIDLYNRPQVKNKDGSISTLRSISIDDENGHSVLIPTVVGNKVVSNKDAVSHYLKTGEHLGKFIDNMYADAHSYRLHGGQQSRYRTGVAPLGSLQQGTAYVPQTGPYQLHQGEMVIPNLADPTTGRRIAAAVPGYLKGQVKGTARQVYDVNITNILTQMYKRFTGQPNTLHKMPKEAVKTWLNFATADAPGLTDLLTMHGMPEAEQFTKWLAGGAKAEDIPKPTGKELYEMAGRIRRPADPIPERVGTLRPIPETMTPEVRQRMTYNPQGGPLAARPTFTPQPGQYQTGAAIPWSPEISRAIQQQPAATVNLQQALERMQKGQAMFGQGNTPFSVPISTKGTDFWGY